MSPILFSPTVHSTHLPHAAPSWASSWSKQRALLWCNRLPSLLSDAQCSQHLESVPRGKPCALPHRLSFCHRSPAASAPVNSSPSAFGGRAATLPPRATVTGFPNNSWLSKGCGAHSDMLPHQHSMAGSTRRESLADPQPLALHSSPSLSPRKALTSIILKDEAGNGTPPAAHSLLLYSLVVGGTSV